jgi:hypothetical protein
MQNAECRMQHISLGISLGRISETRLARTCRIVRSAQMLARSGVCARRQKAELRRWLHTLRKLIFAKASECSRLESVTGWRRHEHYVRSLRANGIGDNQEFACLVGVPSNIGKWAILRMTLMAFHPIKENGLEIFESHWFLDRSYTLQLSEMAGPSSCARAFQKARSRRCSVIVNKLNGEETQASRRWFMPSLSGSSHYLSEPKNNSQEIFLAKLALPANRIG